MAIPHDTLPDSTTALLQEGYTYIARRCRRFGSDIFEARLMLHSAICISGPEAAKQFYKSDQITRRGGVPRIAFTLIQDNDSVMATDGERHRVRKAMFLSLMGEDAMARLAALTERHLREYAEGWTRQARVVLLPEIEHVFCQATTEWAGLVLPAAESARVARDCAAMVDGMGSFGRRNLIGHVARSQVERQMRALIRRVRAGEAAAPVGSALAVTTRHKDAGGALIDVASAAVELINVIRAGVADARYAVFARDGDACRPGPEWAGAPRGRDTARRLRTGGAPVLSVHSFHRRACVNTVHLAWAGLCAKRVGADGSVGHEPRPEVLGGAGSLPAATLPEAAARPVYLRAIRGGRARGGASLPRRVDTQTHIKAAARVMARDIRYSLPPQDLRIDLGRMPALPQSRLVLANVQI